MRQRLSRRGSIGRGGAYLTSFSYRGASPEAIGGCFLSLVLSQPFRLDTSFGEVCLSSAEGDIFGDLAGNAFSYVFREREFLPDPEPRQETSFETPADDDDDVLWTNLLTSFS